MQLILDENDDGTFDLSYVKLRDPGAKTLLMEDVVGKGVDIRVLDDGENHEVYVDGQLMVVNSMTDRPEEDFNHARWGLYTPKSPIDRDILILVSGAYAGPVQSAESVHESGIFDDVISWIDPEALQAWFTSYFGDGDSTSYLGPDIGNDGRIQDSEPSAEFLKLWYDNEENSGYGYF